MRVVIVIFLLAISLFGSNRYQTIDKSLYKYLEYKILSDNKNELFVLTQPYSQTGVISLIGKDRYKEFLGLSAGTDPQIGFLPGISLYHDDDNDNFYPYFEGKLYLPFKDLSLYVDGRMDKTVEFDPSFHGDDGEQGMGYFDEAYGIYSNGWLELFGGRVARNWGALNDYGLILSNNPYTYDHFGFSAKSSSIKYSYYFTRLNNMYGTDFQGIVIKDSLANGDFSADVNRYWSTQRIDYKISRELQMGFTQATVYGGSNQGFDFAYLSPLNFYYLSQRNGHSEMSFYLGMNVYYRFKGGTAFYGDLFMDDLTVNNEEGQDDRADHPDRLGVMFKGSFNDLIMDKSIFSLRYVRIWNDSYTTYRDFENYIYFNKSMGFPFNAHEGVKFDLSGFQFDNLIWNFGLDLYRQGGRDVKNLYDGEKDSFPVGPVTFGVKPELELLLYIYGFRCSFTTIANFYSLDKKKILSDEVDLSLNMKIVYDFNFTL